MKIQKFEEIKAWQKAQDLAIEIYDAFNRLKDYSFKDQLCRAIVSVSNNIAEGFDRSTDADFCRFLFIALGSCSEVKSMLYLSERLKYIDNGKMNKLLLDATEISKIIRGLIKSLKR